uniref:Uncharacterized protein LOC100181867 n=1 Tax=Phallusia mammillata TaxID=59560 RepID=A0A6F9DHR5_9ASCI|nr:uncharacterized protein LOC100181867 [Phallusia mammillata]
MYREKMSCIYLVTFNDSKKVVHCEKCDLYDKVAAEFNITKSMKLCQWNSDFDEWIDVGNLENLPNKTKLTVKLTEESHCSTITSGTHTEPHFPIESASSSSSVTTVPLDSDEDEDSQTAEDMTSLANSHNTDPWIPPLIRTEPKALISSRVRSNKNWMVDYNLSKVPVHVLLGIEACKEDIVNITSSTRRGINQWLFNDLSSHALYPSSAEYNTVVMAFLRKFPFLADKNNKNPMGTWLEGIRQKFRDARRSMAHVPEVMAMKKKYGTKTQRPPLVETEITPAKRIRIMTQNIAEDEHSIAAYVKEMMKECKKNVKNMDLIKDRMQRTFVYRQEEAKNGSLTITDIIEKYPAYQFPAVIFDEAKRLFKVDLQEELKNASHSILPKLKKMLEPKLKSVPEALLHILKENEVLCCIPLLFTNKLDMFIQYSDQENSDVTTPYPCILATEHADPAVYVQKRWLCNCSTFGEALIVLITSYWIFDVRFPKALTCTLQLLSFVLKISETIQNPTVQKIINSL